MGHCYSNVPKLSFSSETGLLWLSGPSFSSSFFSCYSLFVPLLLGQCVAERSHSNERCSIILIYTNAKLQPVMFSLCCLLASGVQTLKGSGRLWSYVLHIPCNPRCGVFSEVYDY